MRRCLVLAVVVLGLVFPAGAGAVTLVRPDGQVAQPFQRWADRAKVPTAQRAVTVREEPCPGTEPGTGNWPVACTYLNGSAQPIIYMPPPRDPWTLYHELGHVWDWQQQHDGNIGYRSEFERVMKYSAGDWWHSLQHDGSGPNSELFAEGYNLCALGIRLRRGEYIVVEYGFSVWRWELRRVCGLIRHAGGWYMTPAN